MKKILVFTILIALFLVACTPETTEQVPERATEVDVEVREIHSNHIHSVLIQGNAAVQDIEDGYETDFQRDAQFMPTDSLVRVGDTVEWTNVDTVEHSITLSNLQLDEHLPIEGKAEFKFTQPGRYEYFCRYHQGKRGTVIVR